MIIILLPQQQHTWLLKAGGSKAKHMQLCEEVDFGTKTPAL